MAATFAGIPTLSRRKSTLRYCFLCPPPRCQTTTSPWLLRPPERFFGSSKAFSGSCFVMWLLSTTVMNRREAVYGLKLFSPIAASYLLLNLFARRGPLLQVLRVLDHFFVFRELDVRFLPIAPVAFVLAATAHFAYEIRRAHVGDFHLENLLHGFLDLRLGGACRNFENHRVLRFLHAQAFFRDNRPANNFIMRGRHDLFLPLFLCGLCRFFSGRFCLFHRSRFRRRFLLRRRGRRGDRFHVRNDDRALLRVERVAQARNGIFRKNQ